jgi:hypothetical protein
MKPTIGKLHTAVSLISLLSIQAVSGPALAGGGGCPAFTSAMVDAAWLATDYSQPEPPVGGAIDDPSTPFIGCQLTNDAGNQFELGVGNGEALLFGNGENTPTGTSLRTRVFNLTSGEERACRAQVRASFVWNTYCKPTLVSTSPPAHSNSAFVFKGGEGTCGWYTDILGVPLSGERFHVVGNYAGGPFPGNGKATCRGTHDLELESAVTVRGEACFVGGAITEDTLFVATPGGQWTVQCNFPKAE